MTTERDRPPLEDPLVARYLATFDEPVADLWAVGVEGYAARLIEATAGSAHPIEVDTALAFAETNWYAHFSDWDLFRLYVSEDRAGLKDGAIRAMTREAEELLLAAVAELNEKGRGPAQNLRRVQGAMEAALASGDQRRFDAALARMTPQAREAANLAAERADLEVLVTNSIDRSRTIGHVRSAAARLEREDPTRLGLAELENRLSTARGRAELVTAWDETASEIRDLVETEASRAGAPWDFISFEYRQEVKSRALELALSQVGRGRRRRLAHNAAARLLAEHHCRLAGLKRPSWRNDKGGQASGPTLDFIARAAKLYDVALAGPGNAHRLRRRKAASVSAGPL